MVCVARIFAIALFLLVLRTPMFASAQQSPAPGPGEIELIGAVTKTGASAGTFTMAATSVTFANGQTTRFQYSRAKTVIVTSATRIVGADGSTASGGIFKALSVAVIGNDNGVGRPITARIVQFDPPSASDSVPKRTHSALTGRRAEVLGAKLEDAASDGDLPRVRSLIGAGADVNLRDAYNYTALRRAIVNRHLDCVDALLDAGADVNAHDENPLIMEATSIDEPDAVRALIAAGADVNIKGQEPMFDGTALTVAAQRGESDIVKMLVSAGADANAKLSDGATAIELAENADCVHALFAGGAIASGPALNDSRDTRREWYFKAALESGVDINCGDLAGLTPLMKAAILGNGDEIKSLIAAGADVNEKSKSGITALMFAAAESNTDCETALIAAGADVNAKDEMVWTPLMHAAGNGHADCIAPLVAAGADVNAHDVNGETAITLAAADGSPDSISALISAHADVNAKDNGGETALMSAVQFGVMDPAGKAVQCVAALIGGGADVNAADNNSETPLRSASGWAVVEWIVYTPNGPIAFEPERQIVKLLVAAGAVDNPKVDLQAKLMEALGQGDAVQVKAAIAAGADVNATDRWGDTPMFRASDAACAKALVAAGANVDARDNEGNTALISAASASEVSYIDGLIAAGADVNAHDSGGWTALMNAANHNCAADVKALIAAGADINATDYNGQTALRVSGNNPDIVAILQAAGATH